MLVHQELSHIQPVLDSAKQAVGQIKSDHINEIRSVFGGILRVLLLPCHDYKPSLRPWTILSVSGSGGPSQLFVVVADGSQESVITLL